MATPFFIWILAERLPPNAAGAYSPSATQICAGPDLMDASAFCKPVRPRKALGHVVPSLAPVARLASTCTMANAALETWTCAHVAAPRATIAFHTQQRNQVRID